MLLSSCVVWRYRDLDEFRSECPGGDPGLQREVIDRLDDGIAWLRSLGAKVVWEETGNPRTVGVRFDPRSLTEVLVRAAGEVRLRATAPADAEQLVLASGGFQGDRELVREHIAPGGELLVRANRWSAGDGLRLALERGAALSGRNGRVLRPRDAGAAGRRAGGALRRARAALRPSSRSCSTTRDTSSRRTRSRGPRRISSRRSPRGRTQARGTSSTRKRSASRSAAAPSAEMVEAARAAGGEVLLPNELGVELPGRLPLRGARRRRDHAHDRRRAHRSAGARARADGTPIEGLYAAGADAGGISTGGYASGLASALVFGRIAAETVAALLALEVRAGAPRRREAATVRSSGRSSACRRTRRSSRRRAALRVPRGARSPRGSTRTPDRSARRSSERGNPTCAPRWRAARPRFSCPPR